MQIALFGTSEFAIPTLEHIQSSGHTIVAVVTQPARPRGRGRKSNPGPVETAARGLKLPVYTPKDPNATSFVDKLTRLHPDLCVLTAYGCILKQPLLQLPRHGFINLHPSLLPCYRGAAPIQRALFNGDTETGVTAIQMNTEIDAGDILNQKRVHIGPDETAGELTARLASAGADLILETIPRISQGTVHMQPQNHSSATRAPKITESERLIDWGKTAVELHNLIRGLAPKPGAFTYFHNRRIIVLCSRLANVAAPAEPGTLILERPGLSVATGSGVLELLELKPEGRKVQSGQSFRNGYRPKQGDKFDR